MSANLLSGARLSDVSIRAKLFGAVALFCLLTAVAGGLGLFFLMQVDSIRRDGAERIEPMSEAAAELLSGAERMRSELTVAMASDTAEAVARADEAVAELSAKMQGALDTLAALAESDPALIADMRALRARLTDEAHALTAALHGEIAAEDATVALHARLAKNDAMVGGGLDTIVRAAEAAMNARQDGAPAQSAGATQAQLSAELDTVLDQIYPALRGAYKLQTIFVQQSTAIEDMLFATDIGASQAHAATAIDLGRALTRQAEALAPRLPEASRAALASLTAPLADRDAILTAEDGLIAAHETALARRQTANEARAAVSALITPFEAATASKFAFAKAETAAGAKQAETAASEAQWIVGATILAASLLSAVAGAVLVRSLSDPIVRLAQVMHDIAEGADETQVPSRDRKDEIGGMAEAVEVFRGNTREIRLSAARREADARDAAARAARQQVLQTAIASSVKAAVNGDFTRHIKEELTDDDLKAVADQVNSLLGSVDAGVNAVSATVASLAGGDLDQRMQGAYSGVFERLQNDLNGAMDRLRDVVLHIKIASADMAAGVDQIANGATELSGRAESQAASLEETAAAMEEITSTVQANAENAGGADRNAAATQSQAERGREVVADTVQAMTNIRESASQISAIVTTIDSIAFQTNLLALNAAVEAARAGEQGKGFAVVASEVRTLAQRSSEAAKTIAELIAASNENVQTGDRLVNATDVALSEIVDGVRSVARTIGEIATASSEQTTSVREVSTAINAMDQNTQKNSLLAEKSAGAAQDLARLSGLLSETVGFFKTRATAPSDMESWDRDAEDESRGAAAA